MHWIVVCLALCFVCSVGTTELIPDGINVCSKQVTYKVTVTVSVAYLTTVGNQECCKHFMWCWQHCTLYKQVRRYTHKTKLQTRRKTEYYCCNGYLQKGAHCLTPICSTPCIHGRCVAPYNCKCNAGYTGSDCGIDIDECLINNGGCQHKCQNQIGHHLCSCHRGYYLPYRRAKECVDADECAVSRKICSCAQNNPTCTSACTNQPGTYSCKCSSGYENPIKGICTDTNECAVNNGDCSHICLNKPGSFHCTCPVGFTLLGDKKTCIDTNECAVNNGECSHICLNKPGSFHCTCLVGYTLHGDKKTCIDTNECAVNNGDCSQICLNKPGSFQCACRVGYTLHGNKKTCIGVY